MPNPFLPLWEYIPDGEPRVFGDRVYIYGSHDRAASAEFCDHKLKVWSAPIDDLNNWQCHGDSFRTKDGGERPADTDWTRNLCFAPDVVEKDGKYYLYSYIVGAKGAVGVSDKPEGPFRCLGQYIYDEDTKVGDDGIFNDAGVLVDDDGRVYVYYGFTESNMNELDPADMRTVIKGSYKRPVIGDSEDIPEDRRFFEASSPRKINGTYYLIYSPRKGSRLAYATSDSPTGPFTYRGYIIDNGVDYPAGNDHGSVMCINGQWYVFYHRMTNGSISSRRACVERIEILEDGTIPPVEMTSLGFEKSLDPYRQTPAEIACVLTGGCFVTERDIFTRPVVGIKDGCVLGYKYFDFGDDYTGDSMTAAFKVRGTGMNSRLHIRIDDRAGEDIGVAEIGTSDGVYRTKVKNVTGRHAVYLVADDKLDKEDWMTHFFEGRALFELEEFVFMK
ncbi:Carbohydrate binding module (family 6) [Ruminococcus sp. YE71]|uniref:family 43 glycosylhydrolase n=1 Tax=unclassified Ruminococcus TaxID=2608920 RepID=UPI00087E13C0|nr:MULTISPECIES: family 43 glycosylhydrolase [unclassified Ruminococcus]SDA21618.1 Carbohydrate binding module (family 6) [Ruminococcus sp. YE78]SFW36544.1 Carbohydrate binding module (family 6) [Ruminococcus sp. YE71]